MLMRRIAATFLRTHSSICINGIPLSVAVQTDFASIAEFVEYVVLADGVDAQLLVVSVMSLALRINLDCVYIDMSDLEVVPPAFYPPL